MGDDGRDRNIQVGLWNGHLELLLVHDDYQFAIFGAFSNGSVIEPSPLAQSYTVLIDGKGRDHQGLHSGKQLVGEKIRFSIRPRGRFFDSELSPARRPRSPEATPVQW